MRRCVRPALNGRFFSATRKLSTAAVVEDIEFTNRRAIVKENHLKYYPSLSSIKNNNTDRHQSTLRIPDFRNKFSQYEFPNDIKRIDDVYTVNGKITSIRKSGKGMMFIDVVQDFTNLQIVASNKTMNLTKEEFAELHAFHKPGDTIRCIGHPGVTNVGELSLKLIKPIINLSPALRALPPKLTDTAKVNSHRVVDYLVNHKSRDAILVRSKMISLLRRYFDEHGFIEVETPIVAGSGTGANAKPFVTSSHHLKDKEGVNLPLYLRVAPELWLKKMIIAGFDKVFEIGKNFRNEGLDMTHNPEFTSCEFYQTFTDLEDLMNMTQEILSQIFEAVNTPQASQIANAIEQNSSKFAKFEFISTVEKMSGETLPTEFTSESLSEYFNTLGLEHPTSKSPQQYLDKLSSLYIEPLCEKDLPTFIYNQPSVMSALAKSVTIEYDDDNRGRKYDISKRFELFINGKEYVNAYEEENNPFKQMQNFKLQQAAKTDHLDEESIVPDYKFVENMELGMSPTGGWGLGIDRLVMLLTGCDRIENVLTFGKLNDVLRQ